MSDVGRLADVSAQTVSRFFTGSGYVRADTRLRIEAAIAELDFRPNHTARNLRTNRTQTVGVLAMGQSNHGLWSILDGLSRSARLADYSLLIAQLDIDIEAPNAFEVVRHTLDGFQSSHVDGIIVSTPFHGTEQLLDHIWDTIPVVSVSGRPWSSADSATADSYAAGLLATQHLTGLGHRRILHLAGPETRIEALDRDRGYRDGLAQAGLEALPLVRGDWTAASGHAAGQAVDPADFTAVFAGNDQMALGFMSALRDRRLHAPQDYSIIGIDDMPDAKYFAPPLSSVFLDFTSLGATAFAMIHERIRTGERLERRVIAPVLVARESTAARQPVA
ncbi:LacI family DNA-binding transcriptional regulator [Pengzhenrongella frigida]|uniref:LacI family transcriptional regulator n=1 Tax=Pengzhenrongella frigida TaxID=1259133 RepID=A0A4Q5N544_9MICO|nr:LacI family DNA-binding transcriptional regulator [Cellulomonas sp. HLT2-17]RYV51181.1 LacI family transcriptional regulator [Cellulomonas sp. HLT2-17]